MLPDQKPDLVGTAGSTKKLPNLDLSEMTLNALNIDLVNKEYV